MSDIKPAPYPADTSAKGWRFELDYERIERSGTWALAGPEARPWLLMMWMKAWGQLPCGSMPNDEEIIAALIGMPPELWEKHRRALLRGWWLADDGLLYHDTLALRVGEMMAKRRSDADRQAARRAKTPSESPDCPSGVTRDTHATPAELHPESNTDHRPPKKRLSKPTASHPLAGGFDDFWLSWPKNERKQDKAKCLDRWKRHDLASVAELIVADVRVKRGTQKWAEGYVEAPLVYLTGRRWEDGVEPDEPKLSLVQTTTPAAETADEYTARIANERAAAERERQASMASTAARDAALAKHRKVAT